jgi:hypothetical protein
MACRRSGRSRRTSLVAPGSLEGTTHQGREMSAPARGRSRALVGMNRQVYERGAWDRAQTALAAPGASVGARQGVTEAPRLIVRFLPTARTPGSEATPRPRTRAASAFPYDGRRNASRSCPPAATPQRSSRIALLQIVFLVRVPFREQKWSTSDERRSWSRRSDRPQAERPPARP